MDNSRLRSFPPIVDRRSKVLVLGTMPGPEALRRRQYYGFPGNQFWAIISRVLGREKPASYAARVRMLRESGVALWDTLASCVRPGALDSSIRGIRLNDIPGLLERHPGIRAVFVNGRSADAFLRRHDPARIKVPVLYLSSTSPANASLSFGEKLRRWSAIRDWL